MFIHLGNGVCVDEKKVIGIFDIENTTISRYTKEFLSSQTKKGSIVEVTTELPKSFAVTLYKSRSGRIEEKTYLSQLNVATLNSRNDNNIQNMGNGMEG